MTKKEMEEEEDSHCPHCGETIPSSDSDEGKKVLPSSSVPKTKGGMKFSDSWIANMLGMIIAFVVVIGLFRACTWVDSYDLTCEQNRKKPLSLRDKLRAIKDGRAFSFKLSYGKKPFYCDRLFPKKPKPPVRYSPPPPPTCTALDPDNFDCWEDIIEDWKAMKDGGAGGSL